MVPVKYKYGVRVERLFSYSVWLGIGLSFFGEKCLVISLGVFEISIGKVYDTND